MAKGKRGQRYDDAFKSAAVALVVEQKLPVSRAALQVDVSVDTLHKWIAESGLRQSEHADKTVEQRNKELERENRMLRQERDILKEAVGIFTARPK